MEIYHLKDPGVDGGMISKWILETGYGGVDWFHLSRGQWRARVNTVTKLRII
jgi:hypothetical protein